MNRGYIFIALAALCTVPLFLSGPLWVKLFFGWLAFSGFYYGAGYLSGYGELLLKSKKGRVPLAMKILLFPIFLGTLVFNHFARKVDPLPPLQKIRDGLWVGRRLTMSDLGTLEESGISAVLDVTAEFDAPGSELLPEKIVYFNIPVFDHHVPRTTQLRKAVTWIANQKAEGREVLVHCALGQGRSVMVLLAYMLSLDPSARIEDLLGEIRAVRISAKPGRMQMKMLEKFGASSGRPPMGKTVLVFNPVSGTRDPAADLREIRSSLEPFMELEVVETTREITAEALTRQAVEDGAKRIVAAGGDGTVTAVASELVGTDVVMGIIPRGTANALSVCLFGTDIRVDPIPVCCRHILAGSVRPIDVARCNDGLMLLLAGVGMERGMVERAERDLKTRFGVFAYLVGAVQQLESKELFDVELEIDGEVHRFRSGSVTVANAAPNTSVFAQGKGPPVLDDGMLDVTAIVDVRTRAEALKIMRDLFLGAYERKEGDSNVRHFRGKTIRLETDPPQKLVLDGEIVGGTPVTFETKPRALRVLIDEDAVRGKLSLFSSRKGEPG